MREPGIGLAAAMTDAAGRGAVRRRSRRAVPRLRLVKFFLADEEQGPVLAFNCLDWRAFVRRIKDE